MKQLSQIQKLKTPLIIILSVLGVALILFFIGKKAGSTFIEQIPLPSDQPGEDLSEEEQKKVRQIAIDLHRALKGWALDIFFRKSNPYNQMLLLNDTLFVAVYNDYNQNFGDGETLRSWIENDWYFSKSDAGTAVVLILERMNNLNLM